jgi:hypothetical protein
MNPKSSQSKVSQTPNLTMVAQDNILALGNILKLFLHDFPFVIF